MKQTVETFTDARGRRYEITTVDHTAKHREHVFVFGVCNVCKMSWSEYLVTEEPCE